MDVAASMQRTRPAALAAVVALLLALPLCGGGTLGGTPTSGPQQSYLLRVDDGAMAAVTSRVQSLGGTVQHRLDGLGAAVVRIPASAAEALRSSAGVLGVTPDSPLQLLGSGYSASSDAGSMYNVAQVTGARKTWASGFTGSGVDVALIDSGVTPVAGLDGAGKVVNGPDLSFESQNNGTRYLDTFGHGTFMAGIIAGSDGSLSNGSLSDNYYGVAPNARVISLKVADAHGNTDVSQVIAAIDWVVQHRKDPGMNIRVLNLSFGTPSLQSYLLDPLAYAAEVAWRKGIVVVVSAGNDGTGTGKLLNPAQDPYVLAVGAEDSGGTPSIGDDTIPSFSTRGDGVRNPDVVAPGKSLQGLRVPGSYIDTQYGGTAAFEGRYFRGSGTSQAAAVVSGAAALLLQQRPSMTPDQVKALLTGTATTLPAADVQAQGNGLVNVNMALWSPTPAAKQLFPLSTGTGSLDGARGAAKLVLGGVTLSGEKDIFGNAYSAPLHATQEATETSWTGGTWNGSSWAGSSWAGSSWAGSSWAGSSWAGSSWAGSSWAGSSWATGVWDGSSWAGSSWAGSSWAGSSWAGSSWAGSSWATGSWG
jgi:subtilisin family serine protease